MIDLIPDRRHTFVSRALAHAALSLALLYFYEGSGVQGRSDSFVPDVDESSVYEAHNYEFHCLCAPPIPEDALASGGMLSMSFRHVLVAGTVAISTLARVHSNLLPLIEESYQFSGDPCFQLLA